MEITLIFRKCCITLDNFTLSYYCNNSTFHRKIPHCSEQLRIPFVNWELHCFSENVTLHWIILHCHIIVVISHFSKNVTLFWTIENLTWKLGIILFFEICSIILDNFPLSYYSSNSTFHRKIPHCIGQLRISENYTIFWKMFHYTR